MRSRYGDTRIQQIPEKVIRGIELCKRRFKFEVRSVDVSRFGEELIGA